MTTTTKKTSAKARTGTQSKASTAARKPKKTVQRRAPAPKTTPIRKPAGQVRSGTKQETIMAMLNSRAGATIPAIIKVTGWQPHSVRGFLSGHVKKKLGLEIAREKTDGDSVYRIITAAKSRGRKGKR